MTTKPSSDNVTNTKPVTTSSDESGEGGKGGSGKASGGKASSGKSASANNGASKTRKKTKRQISDGIAHVYSSFNNTIVTITDVQGNAVAWTSAANCGYRGSRKSTPYAAGEAAQKAGKYVRSAPRAHSRPRARRSGRGRAAERALRRPDA